MSNVEDYKKQVLNFLIDEIVTAPEILATWQGGSAANGTSDQYSDIDLCILANAPLRAILDKVETILQKFKVIHTWQPAKSFWGDGMMQRVIVLKEAPRYFSVDVAVFDETHPQLLKDFLEIERHGLAVVSFDKLGVIKPGNTDPLALFLRQQSRVDELHQGFPIFKTLALKEIDRGHAIDAIGFYQNGLVRPFIEVLGMIYRPFKADFGMRYVHKSFPEDKQMLIEDLNYVSSIQELRGKIEKVERAFTEAVARVKGRKTLEG